VSDPTRLVVRPLAVLARRSNLADAEAIRRLADQHQATTIVVGVPLNADNGLGPQARKTLSFTRFLRKHLAVEVVSWDERLSTRDAERELLAQGVRRSRRKDLLDAAAAAVILNDWIAAQRPLTRPTL
jgi:putative Holliday junction resolvase